MFRYILEYKPSGYTIKYLLFVIACFLPINFLLWYISNENDLGRSYFNVDYFIPVIVAALLFQFKFSRLIFALLFLLVYIVDIGKIILVRFGFEENVINAAGNFGDLKLFNLVANLYFGNIASEIRQIPIAQYNIVLVGVILSLLLAAYTFLKKKKDPIKILTTISAVYLLLTLIFISDSVFLLSFEVFFFIIFSLIVLYPKIRFFTVKPDLLVFTMVLFYFLNLGVKSHEAQSERRNFFSNFTTFVVFNFEVQQKGIDSASDIIFESIKNNTISNYDNVILIIVESLGKLNDENSMKAIFNTFNDSELLKNYDVDISDLNYEGHTTTAEFRELCKWQMIGLPNITNKGQFSECLPEVMKQHGFNTFAIHNGSKFVFDRNEWWPLLNFDNIHFLQDMREKYNDKELCNGGKGFTAICEKEVMGNIIPHLMKGNKKNFAYFLTIESHTPIEEDVPVAPEFRKVCDRTPALKDSKAICRIYDIQNSLFIYTIDMAKKLASKNNIIIIVGDHTPPFFKVSLNEAFRKDVIPMVIIKSKKH